MSPHRNGVPPKLQKLKRRKSRLITSVISITDFFKEKIYSAETKLQLQQQATMSDTRSQHKRKNKRQNKEQQESSIT
jgi:hypothetical protein